MSEEKDRIIARKKSILSAAEKIFAAKGYASATVDEIAEKAHISKGSVYNYFKNKQELFSDLFFQEVKQEEALTEQLLQRNIPAKDKFELFLKQCLERFTKYKHLGRLLLEFWITAASEEGEGPFVQAFREMYERYHQQVVAVFEQGVAEGDFVLEYGPEISASLLIAAVDGMHIQVLLGARPPWTQTEFSAFQQAVADALTAGKQRRDHPRPEELPA
ncbi:MAG: TetR/AcrR family transcriptional regulator [Phycisphaerae bacterium]|nr:TetR/AcrR family transcriptional regulator [Phycisphaerae bacterium]